MTRAKKEENHVIIMPLVLRKGYLIVRNEKPLPEWLCPQGPLTIMGRTYEIVVLDGFGCTWFHWIDDPNHRALIGWDTKLMTTEYWLSD